MNKNLVLHIESLIFASEKPITVDDITNVVEETMELLLDPGQVDEAIQMLRDKYSSDDFAIEIIEISGGYALETLSIIAYKQPVSKSEIESIRGVNCDYAIQKLLEKELVEIKGRSEGLGKPLLYGTSEKFFDYFGLRGVQDLPKLKDFELPENSIGVPSSEEVETPVMVDGETVHLETESIVLEDQNDEGPIPDIMNDVDEIQPEEENEIPSDIVE